MFIYDIFAYDNNTKDYSNFVGDGVAEEYVAGEQLNKYGTPVLTGKRDWEQEAGCLRYHDWHKPLGCSGEVKTRNADVYSMIWLFSDLPEAYVDDNYQDSELTKSAHVMYEETCVCDTPLCNVMASPLTFFCHIGDFQIEKLKEQPSQMNKTTSCYTNRQQCYIMEYKHGTVQ